jgi:poly(A) polymerase
MEADSERLNPVWLNGPLRGLLETLNCAGFEAFAVGGCVRDAVMERACNDIDVATNAAPDQVYHFLSDAGWRMVPTGVEHGTWTAVKDNHTFEVTTYRLDVATDGRRATIAYASTMEEDAERRDFTMNALYMDLNGVVYDPTGTGVEDAKMGRIRFVGNADARCKEDHLRILRLYRFFATLGKGPMDSTAAKAAEDNRTRILFVSKERVLAELVKMFKATDSVALSNAIRLMHAHGVTDIVFPRLVVSAPSLEVLLYNEGRMGMKADWRTRVYALLGSAINLPLSKKDRVFIETLAELCEKPQILSIEALAQVHGMPMAREYGCIQGMSFTGKALQVASDQKFPVKAEDFMDKGFTQGQELGKAIRLAQDHWLASDMTAPKEACITTALETLNE